METIIVTIGYGPNSEGIVPVRTAYRADVIDAISDSGYEIAAQIHGESVSEWGDEPASWISAVEYTKNSGNILGLRHALSRVARKHNQDAIGIVAQGEYSEV